MLTLPLLLSDGRNRREGSFAALRMTLVFGSAYCASSNNRVIPNEVRNPSLSSQNAGFFPASAAAKASGFRAERGVPAVMAASSLTPTTAANFSDRGSKA